MKNLIKLMNKFGASFEPKNKFNLPLKLTSSEILTLLNELAGKHGIGRLDLVENRFTGMKSRGCYETPGGTILLKAHRAIESITLDSQAGHLKDEIMPRYSELIYNGFWFSPEREMLQSLIDCSQKNVNGIVKLKLYKGNTIVVGRKSKSTIYSPKMATLMRYQRYTFAFIPSLPACFAIASIV